MQVDDLLRYDIPVPRYTSYPTAPNWHEIDTELYQRKLQEVSGPLSIYVHVPFCHSMCLYCGCSVILNRQAEREEEYVRYLLREIELARAALGNKQPVQQLHFGGGTPTKLSVEKLGEIVDAMRSAFSFEEEAEIAIEIDPRTVFRDGGEKLRGLREIGFNRVSFGVQDTNAKVQEAVRRRQSLEATKATYEWARELSFDGVNIDLIYGLPYQTVETFSETIREILLMRPDRIAMYSYANIPWLKPHQKAIKENTLPSREEKFAIYSMAREQLQGGGYVAIGMDHFAVESDPMAQAFAAGTLHRNFMGYALQPSENMLGFGVSSIGYVEGAYIQNGKDLNAYYAAIDAQHLPVSRGIELSHDDLIRSWVIKKLMCQFKVSWEAFREKFSLEFLEYFAEEMEGLRECEQEGLITLQDDGIYATSLGEMMIRIVASKLDAYLKRKSAAPTFSRGV